MHITLDHAKQAMIGLAHIAPDRVAACSNIEGGPGNWRPCCIVGTFFYTLGVDPEVLYSSGGIDSFLDTANHSYNLEILVDEDAVGFLSSVQRLQDSQFSWKEAVETAIFRNSITNQ